MYLFSWESRAWQSPNSLRGEAAVPLCGSLTATRLAFFHLLSQVLGDVAGPIHSGHQGQGAGQGPGAGSGEGEHPVFQGKKDVFHAGREQDAPEEGELQADVAMEVEPVGLVAPEPKAEHLMEKGPGEQLQPGGDQGGKQEIDGKGGGSLSQQKTSLVGAGGADQEIQQQEGKAVDGAEGQGQKPPVAKLAVGEQKEKGLRHPAQEREGHEQDKIPAGLLKGPRHPLSSPLLQCEQRQFASVRREISLRNGARALQRGNRNRKTALTR